MFWDGFFNWLAMVLITLKFFSFDFQCWKNCFEYFGDVFQKELEKTHEIFMARFSKCCGIIYIYIFTFVCTCTSAPESPRQNKVN